MLTTTHTDRLLVHTGHSTLTLTDITQTMQRWYEAPDLAAAAVDLPGAHEWRHRVRIYHNDYEAAEAWLTSTIR